MQYVFFEKGIRSIQLVLGSGAKSQKLGNFWDFLFKLGEQLLPLLPWFPHLWMERSNCDCFKGALSTIDVTHHMSVILPSKFTCTPS